MRHNLISFATAIVATVTMFASCAENATEPTMDATASTDATTRVGNSKKVMVYVETNDVNPLNALTYVKCGTDVPYTDILNLFAANINKSGNDPCIHFNKELAGYMADYAQYIQPLQDAGIKVNLTLLGNHQGVGVANLQNPAQFARLVAYVVYTYGLDGVHIDDEYAKYPSLVSGSCGDFIAALRTEFNNRGGNKTIGLFQWENYGSSQIDATEGAMLDYVDHGDFGPNTWGSCGVAGVPNSKFFPVAVNLGRYYNSTELNQIRSRARQVATQGYAGVMGFNLRCGSDVSAAPVFNAWARGFANSNATLVEWNGTCYPEGPEIPGGHTITNADVPANF
jgi:hypothetical protein